MLWISFYFEALSVLQSVHVAWPLSTPAHGFTVGNGSLLTFPQSVHVETPSRLSARWMPRQTHYVCPSWSLCSLFQGTELPGLDDAHTLSLTQQSQFRVQRPLCVPGPLRTSHSPFLLTYQRSSSQLSHTCRLQDAKLGLALLTFSPLITNEMEHLFTSC